MDISKELAHDLLAHLECGKHVTCSACRLKDEDCDHNLESCAEALRLELEGVEHIANVSQETAKTQEARLPEPDRPTKYITISVAEYHFLTKAAAWLEVILADGTYSHQHTVDAVRDAVEDMKKAAEAGAAE